MAQVLNQCWFDAGPASQMVGQNWVNVVFAGNVDKCFAPKRNKVCIVSTVHRSHILPLITKAIDTTSISYQPLWLCCWSIFVHKKLDPSSYVSPLIEKWGHVGLPLSARQSSANTKR